MKVAQADPFGMSLRHVINLHKFHVEGRLTALPLPFFAPSTGASYLLLNRESTRRPVTIPTTDQSTQTIQPGAPHFKEP